MISDIYTIDETGASVTDAMEGLAKAGGFGGVNDEAVSRMQALAEALLQVGKGLTSVRNIKLWAEIKPGEAIVHLKADSVIDITEEEELKALSTTGENQQRKGLFEKLRGVFDEMVMADNEELHVLGYIPEVDTEGYPVLWSLAPVIPTTQEKWNDQAAGQVRSLADKVDVGFSSEQVEIAAHMKYA